MLLNHLFEKINQSKTKNLSEGGNIELPSGERAQNIDLKVTQRSYIVPILDNLLVSINSSFSKQFKKPLWNPKLLQSKEFLSGSSIHFFNVKGISDETFVAKKPKVGDIDTQVNAENAEEVRQFLDSLQGKQIGPGKLLGYKSGNEQFSSLWELQDPPIKIQIDFEFVKFAGDEPTDWSKFSHSSAWEDLEAGVKGVFHKYLIQALTALTREDFLLRKLVGRGKSRAEQDVPTTDNTVSFAVSSKEGGGLRQKYEPVLDDNGKPVIKDGLPVYQARPTTGYEQNIAEIFSKIFGTRLNPKQIEVMNKKFWSYVGLLDAARQLLDDSEKDQVAEAFLMKLFGKGAQGLYRGEPERDRAEKMAAVDKMFEVLGVARPGNIDQMISDYYGSYKVTESIFEAESPNYKRQGIKHIYNPGSTVEMKDLEFVEMCKEIARNGGTLDGMAVNLKADGAGIRFGKDASGRPFFMTSKVTEPKYIEDVGDFENFVRSKGQPEDRVEFAKKYDDAMSIILNSDFVKKLPNDVIVQAEMMYTPMAEKTDQGLRFVSIPYNPKKLGKTMTLVPFMFKQFSTGENLEDADKIKKQLLSSSSSDIKFVNNQLEQKGVDVRQIIKPVVDMSPEMMATLAPRTKDSELKQQAKEILTKARKELSEKIISDPKMKGKDQLGDHIEGLVINLPNGQLAKVTSQLMKDSVSAKQAARKTGPVKTAVVAIGSFVGHIGHEQLWDYTVKKAAELGGDPYLFIGHATGPNDPIPPNVKVKTWHKMYPEYKNNISAMTQEGGTLMQKIKHELINPQPGKPPKYDNIVIMVGEDQTKMPIANALMKSVNKFSGYEHVKATLNPTPRGTGISFTQLRNVLKDPNATPEHQYAVWSKGFSEKKLGKDWILYLMDIAKKGMGINNNMNSNKKNKINDIQEYFKMKEGIDPGMAKLFSWKAEVLKAYPELSKKIRFLSKSDNTISAEIPGQDRSYGVFDLGTEEGEVLGETKQRLDPKCWKGYRKSGTKMKDGTRVNNCVKIGEGWERLISEAVHRLGKL
jgi:hypothetical protein